MKRKYTISKNKKFPIVFPIILKYNIIQLTELSFCCRQQPVISQSIFIEKGRQANTLHPVNVIISKKKKNVIKNCLFTKTYKKNVMKN